MSKLAADINRFINQTAGCGGSWNITAYVTEFHIADMWFTFDVDVVDQDKTVAWVTAECLLSKFRRGNPAISLFNTTSLLDLYYPTPSSASFTLDAILAGNVSGINPCGNVTCRNGDPNQDWGAPPDTTEASSGFPSWAIAIIAIVLCILIALLAYYLIFYRVREQNMNKKIARLDLNRERRLDDLEVAWCQNEVNLQGEKFAKTQQRFGMSNSDEMEAKQPFVECSDSKAERDRAISIHADEI